MALCEYKRSFLTEKLCGLTFLDSPEETRKCPFDHELPPEGCEAREFIESEILKTQGTNLKVSLRALQGTIIPLIDKRQ